MKKRYSRAEKAHHWHTWKTSGLSQLAYCHRHGLKRSSFKNWGRAQTDFPLVPVTVHPPLSQQGYKLQWRDCVIELPRDIDSQEWRRVLSALLEQSAC